MRNGVRAYLQDGTTPSVMEEYDPETGEPIPPALPVDGSAPNLQGLIAPGGFTGRGGFNPQAQIIGAGGNPDDEGPQAQEIARRNAQSMGGFAPPDSAPPPHLLGVRLPDAATDTAVGTAQYLAGDNAPGVLSAATDKQAAQGYAPGVDASGELGALKKYEEAVKGTPQMGKPKWWQQGLAAGFGAAAGWTNAAGRIRNPIDINAAGQGILHPMYQQKLAQYEHNVIAPAKAMAELEGQKYALQQGAMKDAATINHLNAQAEYYKSMRGMNVPVTPELEEYSGGTFKRGTTIPATMATEILRIHAGKYDPKAVREPVTPIEKYAEAQKIYPASAGGTPEVWRQMVYNPTSIGKPAAAESAAAQADAFQKTMSKVASEGLLTPGTYSSVGAMITALKSSKTLTLAERNDAMAYLATKQTPAMQGTTASIRVEGIGQSREYSVINRDSGQLEMRSAAEINAKPGSFAPAGAGAQAMSKEAIFSDLNYNISNARQAIHGLGTVDAGTRAALAYVLRHTDPASAMQNFLTSSVAANLTPAQQEAVQSLALLAENAMSLRTVAGIGAGSDQVRSAILATIPGPNTPSGPYALAQLDKLQKVVDRLHTGVPGMGNASSNRNQQSSVPPPAEKHQSPPVIKLKEGHDTQFANGQVWRLVQGQPHEVINGRVQ